MDLLARLSILNVEHVRAVQGVKLLWLGDRKPVNKSCTCTILNIFRYA